MPWYKDCRDFSKLDANRFVQLQTLFLGGGEGGGVRGSLRDCRFYAQTTCLLLDKCSKVPFLA